MHLLIVSMTSNYYYWLQLVVESCPVSFKELLATFLCYWPCLSFIVSYSAAFFEFYRKGLPLKFSTVIIVRWHVRRLLKYALLLLWKANDHTQCDPIGSARFRFVKKMVVKHYLKYSFDTFFSKVSFRKIMSRVLWKTSGILLRKVILIISLPSTIRPDFFTQCKKG